MKKANKHAKKARAMVEDCIEQQGDPEAAHCAEDDAYKSALKAIAAGYEPAEALAKEVLVLTELDFDRWYA